jgi:hypothetical protein
MKIFLIQAAFLASGITGQRLAALDNRDWERLGVTRIQHRHAGIL